MTILRTLILTVLVSLTMSVVAAPSLLEYELKSLQAPELHKLERYAGKPLLLVFFKPECSWCFRQVRAINQLQETCRHQFQALAVGVEGNRTWLKETLRRMRPEFPAYEASPRLLKDLGGVPATPFSLLGDAGGEYRNYLRGYIPPERLAGILETAGNFECAT